MKNDQSQRINQPNQIFSQVILPFLLAFVMVAFAGYSLFFKPVSASADFRMWSDISVMVIFLPLMLLALLWMMILLAHIVLVVKIQKLALDMGNKLRPGLSRFVNAIADMANLSTKPMIALMSRLPFIRKQK